MSSNTATRKLQRNLATVATEYPDIFTNVALSQLAAIQLHELRQRNAPVLLPDGKFVPFNALQELDQYRTAANQVRQVSLSGEAAGSPTIH